jgi:tripartite-type tricarboxylate transporter receptor subunit TctC
MGETMKFAGISRALAPPKLPKALVTRLHADLVKILNEPDVQKIIHNQGATAVGNTPEDFRYLLAGLEKWKKVVAASGAKAN